MGRGDFLYRVGFPTNAEKLHHLLFPWIWVGFLPYGWTPWGLEGCVWISGLWGLAVVLGRQWRAVARKYSASCALDGGQGGQDGF